MNKKKRKGQYHHEKSGPKETEKVIYLKGLKPFDKKLKTGQTTKDSKYRSLVRTYQSPHREIARWKVESGL